MDPIYKFTLAANGGTEQQAFPVYRDDLAKDYELQTNEEFYRAKLSGKLTFVRDDYDFIASKSFDTQFDIKIYISYDAGQTWTLYWRGQFWKTNCTFNADDKNVILTPDVVDQYTDVLAGMEKEYNLIELAPEIVPVRLDKRPCIQIVEPNSGVIGFAMSGNGLYWESECDPSTDAELVSANFGVVSSWYPIQLTWNDGDVELLFSTVPITSGTVTINYGKYRLQITQVAVPGGGVAYNKLLTRNGDGAQWSESGAAVSAIGHLEPVSGTAATGTVDYTTLSSSTIYGRIITDVVTAWSLQNDIVYNNRNYHYCEPCANNNDLIQLSGNFSTTPTKYGIKQPGKYYDVPDTTHHWEPVAQNMWGDYSVWINVDELVSLDLDNDYSAEMKLNNSYPLASVISVLLAQVAPGLTHQETANYSQFFYGTKNPLGITQRIFITPKSNMISLGYDQPAQKAPVTLKRILDMLRDCFRCFWFVDDQNRFRIEHVSYFMNGGAYPGTPNYPVIGRDLTVEQVTRSGKKWAFGTSEFKFDKPEMAARYQFGWMDDVTELFDGYPIDIISKYVNPDNIEQIDVSQFTSDVDYVLLNPSEISKDGFVLLAGTRQDFSINATSQNGYLTPDGTYVGLQNYKSKTTQIIQCEPGQKFYYKGRGQWPAMSVLYYNNNTIVGYDSFYSESDYVVITIPDGANKVVFSSFAPSSGTVILSVYTGDYKLPCINFRIDGIDHYLQNAYVAFIYLQQYYFWDMPACYFKYNGEQMAANGIKRLKTQTLKFPAFTDPNTLQLIKTNLGNGTIQKMSVNLSSRIAQTTLKYDTE